MSLWVVVGGQYGSEGKGKVAAYLTRREDIDICVRCGGPNSGHSFIDNRGNLQIWRQLPTGHINPRTRLLIPAGALIDPDVLFRELRMVDDSEKRVGIDKNAFIIEKRDRAKEKRIGLRKRLSSTLCGVGAAQSRRALRDADSLLASQGVNRHPWIKNLLTDVSTEVNHALDENRKVLIEGTQGFGLSLYHSPYYPHTTSRDTTASAFLSEVGVGPTRITDVVLVLRTFPIRVAGKQAGPIKDEIRWNQLRLESGYPYDITEVTSVTKRIRRIGRFDWNLAIGAVQANAPTTIALNGLDYLDYSNRGINKWDQLSEIAKSFVEEVEAKLGKPVKILGTGPSLSEVFIRKPHELLKQKPSIRTSHAYSFVRPQSSAVEDRR